MALIFLDSSAVIKLHVQEVGSSWLQSYIANEQVVISQLALFETANTARRLLIEGSYTRYEALDLITQVLQRAVSYQIIQLGNEPQLHDLISLIFGLPLNLRVRTLDSIHLAVAHITFKTANAAQPPQPFVFVSADLELLKAAQSMGFATENPQDHP